MTINVPGCRILIKPVDVTEKDKVYASAKKAGIAILEKDERQLQANVDKGTVLQIGPKAAEDYIQGVEVGSVIGFTKFGGKFVEDGDEMLLIINDEDVICIFKDN